MFLISILSRLLKSGSRIEIFLSVFYKLLWRLAPSVLQVTRTISMGDFLMAFRPFILSDQHITDPGFEKDVRAHFQPKTNQTVLDVGAHIGLYTLMACRLVGRNGQVISVEPDESNLMILKKNITLNNFDNAVILQVALGRANGWRTFYAGIMPTGSSLNPTHSRMLYKVRAIKEIRIAMLDSLLEELEIKDVDWIKIDAENMDLEVLRGGEFFLKNSKKVKIIIEVSGYQTLEYLKSLDFHVRRLNSSYYFAFKNASKTK